MRLFLLENFGSEEFENWDTDEMTSRVKKDCPKFISEFISKGIYVYRGLDRLSSDKAYIVPTQEQRIARGIMFRNEAVANSFDKYLEQNKIGSRYRNSVSTTTSEPSEFKGILVNSWYYFIPKGNYQYHYHKGVENDLNMVRENTPAGSLKLYSRAIGSILKAHESLERIDVFNFDDYSPMLLVYDSVELGNLFKQLNIIIEVMKNIFQNENYIKINSMIPKILSKLKTLEDAFRGSNNHDMDSASLNFGIIHKHLTELLGLDGVVEGFLNTIVSNKIDQNLDRNEVVFTCKDYYIIPYPQGKDFMDRLR